MSEDYLDKRLRETPVPAGKHRAKFVVELVLDVDGATLRDPDHLSDIATWLDYVLKKGEHECDPWLTRDVTVFEKEVTNEDAE